MNRALSGLYGGIIATGPMTLFMMGRHSGLPAQKRSALPPATLSFQTLEFLGLDDLSKNSQSAVTMMSHFGYGGAAGALYSGLFQNLKLNPVLKGTLYGLGVWAINYEGFTPLAGFRAAAPRMPQERNNMMIVAHLIWGACLGYAVQQLAGHGKEMLAGEVKAPAAE